MISVNATFSVWSKQFTPDDISEKLGMLPDRAVLMGSERTPKRNAPDKHGWHISNYAANEGWVEAALKVVIERLASKKTLFLSLKKQDKTLEFAFIVAVHGEPKKASLYLSAETIASICEFGASLDIDFW